MSRTTLDLRPKIIDVLVSRGDAWSVGLTLTGVAAPDLAGATILAHLREQVGDATELVLDTSVVDGVLNFGQTEATVGGYYDVQIAESGGLPRTYVKGYVTVDPDVSRP